MLNEIEDAALKIEGQLKPFQKASVQYVLDQFLINKRKKVLIADEVGLGKTIVAKGVLINLLQEKARLDEKFHVVYICSNQVLASQNIDKLNPYKERPNSLSRLIFLVYKKKETENFLQLSSLSPGTSFQLTRSEGIKEERAIIVGLLSSSFESIFNPLIEPLKILLKGHKKDLLGWDDLTANHIKNRDLYYRKGLSKEFKSHLQTIPFKNSEFKSISEFLQNREFISFFDALKSVLKKIRKNPEVNLSNISYEVIRTLRVELTKVCLQYLEADLFILDEFQRFKTLLDGEDHSEAGELAKTILQNKNSNVLLLSATPFKPYTTQLEQLGGEAHYEEFQKIIEFIGGEDGHQLWKEFRKDQEAFFQILRHPKEVLDSPLEARKAKYNLENSFKTFLSRNERMSIAKNYNNMTQLALGSNINIIPEDVRNFIALDQLCEELKKDSPQAMRHFGSTVEFSKSAAFPLSFLHNYKLHDYITEQKENPKIQEILDKFPSAWIDYHKVQNYKPIGFYRDKPTYPNAKFRALAEECFDKNAEFLLWVPPTKPFYKSFGVFKESSDFSKILIFSNWAMVPRAVSTLLSYEVERRTVGTENVENTKEDVKRKYFTDDSKRRPRPLLLYKKNEDDGKAINMANFILAYPSITFYLYNPLKQSDFSKSYSEIKNDLIKELETLVQSLNFKQYYIKRDTNDKVWYWLALPLIDFLVFPKEFKTHLNHLSRNVKGTEKDNVKFLINYVESLKEQGNIGDFPPDLFDVLSDIILASPANASLFSIKNNFPKCDDGLEIFSTSFLIADAFIAHFNKPESIAAIRLASPKSEYWRQVLDYCASGNITAMLTEYIYLLMDCEDKKNLSAILVSLENVLKVNTSNNLVDLRHKSGRIKPYNMRTHFAVNYGTQQISSDSGKDRMVNLRTVFNSPFRPFVLTSTSIGQEGLDFHYYCHKIFHWNLPHNPIDLEQREGRINRYKGLVIRRKIAEQIVSSDIELTDELWKNIFEKAEKLASDDKSGIKPYWYLDQGKTMINRFVPIHHLSKDNEKYDRLKSTLALYRLTFGQPRQEELVEAIKSSGLSEEEILQLRKDLLVNLSPYHSNGIEKTAKKT